MVHPEKLTVGIINASSEPYIPANHYFERSNCIVKMLRFSDKVASLDNLCDVVLVWANTPMTIEQVTAHAYIIKKSDGSKINASGKPVFTPVLIQSDEKFFMPDTAKFPHLTLLPRSIDLRALDSTLMKMIGKDKSSTPTSTVKEH
jgi:hypothetical protein